MEISPAFIKVMSLLLFLLNPFFLSIYMLDIFEKLDKKTFRSVMFRGSSIATIVFVAFAWFGDSVFTDILHSKFSSFQIFGGIIFLIIGIRFVFEGEASLLHWRGDPEYIAGAIAMPFFIGPGTVMASVMAGGQLHFSLAVGAIVLAVALAVIVIILLKCVYDFVSTKSEKLIQRYVLVMGRIMALVVGTFSIEMLTSGIESWWKSFNV